MYIYVYIDIYIHIYIHIMYIIYIDIYIYYRLCLHRAVRLPQHDARVRQPRGRAQDLAARVLPGAAQQRPKRAARAALQRHQQHKRHQQHQRQQQIGRASCRERV